MPSDTPIDYGAVLADLKQQREKLDAAIAGIEMMLGMRSMSATQSGENNLGSISRAGQFLGMTIVDATIEYLKSVRQAKRTEDIVKALREGGIVFTSESPVNTVGSILNRNWNQGGEIVRVNRGIWGLAVWHPRLRKKAGTTQTAEEMIDELIEAVVPDTEKPKPNKFDDLI